MSIQTQRLFAGFSTVVPRSIKGATSLFDIALIKQDLTNHFNTRLGERVMRPEFGCRIWDYLMEPLTAVMRDMVVAEATRVCESDSRVNVDTINVVELAAGLRIEITLLYVPYAVLSDFSVQFETRQASAPAGLLQ